VAACDLFVSHAGGACAGTLAAGVPQLMFPAQYEQYLTALRVVQLRAGVLVKPTATPRDVGGALAHLLGDPSHAAAAKAYAARYPDYTPQEHVRRVVARIEEILAGPSRWERRAILAPR
jgi:UDP:flavonoid glycosyltransferase YjiC (YdhE family)